MSERTTIGGTVYEAIGSSNSNLLLKCNGTARIQWGNKLIDIIKNGKIVSGETTIPIHIVQDKSEIKKDGIYIIESDNSSQVWINKDNKSYSLIDSDLYISATNVQDITAEQKKQALENIGLYFNTLNDVERIGVQNGLVYILEEQKLYTVKDGKVTEFGAISKTVTVEQEKIQEDTINTSITEEKISTNVQTFSRGMILMYSGLSAIPDGWVICDGSTYTVDGVTVKTPNLTNKFIKAVSTQDLIGPTNNADLNENNEFVLTKEHLPSHNHLHQAHTHNLSMSISNSGELEMSLGNFVKDVEIYNSPFVTEVVGEGVTTTTSNALTNINTLLEGDTIYGGDHTHSISDAKVSSTTSEELEQTWNNKPFKIEPNYYSLIFIMKL